jgi:antitoxin component YwqK of YwqJK toxin-antitoxin module
MIEAVYTFYEDGSLQREQLIKDKKVVTDIHYHPSGKVAKITEFSEGNIVLNITMDEEGNDKIKATYDASGNLNTVLDTSNPNESVLFYFYENKTVASKMVIYPDGGKKQIQEFLNDGTLVYAASWNENGYLLDEYNNYEVED